MYFYPDRESTVPYYTEIAIMSIHKHWHARTHTKTSAKIAFILESSSQMFMAMITTTMTSDRQIKMSDFGATTNKPKNITSK